MPSHNKDSYIHKIDQQHDSHRKTQNLYNEIRFATAWRVLTTSEHASRGWGWDIRELMFYDNSGCKGSPIDSSQGKPIESRNCCTGNTNYAAERAFDGDISNQWGGRQDSDGFLWLGLDFSPITVKVRCLKLRQHTSFGADKVYIQARDNEGKWEDAWIEDIVLSSDGDTVSTISINYPIESESPSEAPTNFKYETEITRATAWRILTTGEYTTKSWGWDVRQLIFYDNLGCEGSPIDVSQATLIDSGSATNGYGPDKVFNDDTSSSITNMWAGRRDNDGLFWIGLDFRSITVKVRCLKLHQRSDVGASRIHI